MSIRDFVVTLLISALLVLVVMNKSINSYIEQKYHIALFNPENPVLSLLGAPREWLDTLRLNLFPTQEDLALESALHEAQAGENSAGETGENSETESSDENAEPPYPRLNEQGQIELKADSTFLFIGDSMMQGVGMTLGRELKKLGFSVIDIARQSTGLTYTSFFDWGKTLKEAFAKNPHINIVVMMVGANDPYNMPKIKYASPEWVEIYEQRIQSILDTAREHGALVVWYEAPIVKKEPLNARLAFLNTLYKSRVDAAKQLFLHSNSALAPDGIYTPYVKNAQGKSIKMRASDGIHFSGDGSRALGALLVERLEIIKEEGEDSGDVDSASVNSGDFGGVDSRANKDLSRDSAKNSTRKKREKAESTSHQRGLDADADKMDSIDSADSMNSADSGFAASDFAGSASSANFGTLDSGALDSHAFDSSAGNADSSASTNDAESSTPKPTSLESILLDSIHTPHKAARASDE